MTVGALLFLTGVFMASDGAAQCIDYSEYLHWQDSADLLFMETDFHGCSASETRAAVLVREFQGDMQWHYFIFPVDVSNSGFLRQGELVETVDDSEDIEVVDEYAYIAYGSRLGVVDLSDVDNPHIVGNASLPSDANGVAVSDDYACVAYGIGFPNSGGLSVVDISNPSAPATVGDLTLPYIAHDVAVVGDLAVVLVSEMLLYVIDISNPNAPQELGSLDTLAGTYAVAAVGDHAYVAAAEAGMQVVDFTDPADPQLVATLPLTDLAIHLRTDSEHAFVADRTSGLHIVDIADPFHPVLESTLDSYRPVFSVGLCGDDLYYTCDYGLFSWDVSSRAYPPLLGSESGPGTPMYLAQAGDYLFAAFNALQVYDIADPANPQFVASEDLPDRAWAMALDGNHAYVAAGTANLQIIDISDPLDPVPVGSLPSGWVLAVDAAGSIACILRDNPGGEFCTVDVADPADPEILGSVDVSGPLDCVLIEGSLAYVGADMFYTIDISDPADPQILDMLDCNPRYSFTVSESYAYVQGIDNSGPFPIYMLYIIDVSNPGDLQMISGVRIPQSYAVDVAWPFAYLASSTLGVYVYNINDPANPVLVGGAHTGDNVRSVLVRDPYVYAGGYAYQGGVDYYTLHVASGQCLPTGLPEMDWRPRPTSLTSFPNPSRGESSVRFVLEERERVVVAIYSPDGRLVRRLLDAPFDPGTHDLSWDGRDDDGHPIPAGVYLARIETSRETRTSRFVILK